MTTNSPTASSITLLRVGEAHNPRLIIANCATSPNPAISSLSGGGVFVPLMSDRSVSMGGLSLRGEKLHH